MWKLKQRMELMLTGPVAHVCCSSNQTKETCDNSNKESWLVIMCTAHQTQAIGTCAVSNNEWSLCLRVPELMSPAVQIKPKEHVKTQTTNGAHVYCCSNTNHLTMCRLKQRIELMLTGPGAHLCSFSNQAKDMMKLKQRMELMCIVSQTKAKEPCGLSDTDQVETQAATTGTD